MIVPMKHLDLVCLASDRDATLERLRLLGAVHLELSAAGGEAVAKAKGDIADAERWGVMDPARWEAFYSWLNEYGLVEGALDPAAGFTNDFLP